MAGRGPAPKPGQLRQRRNQKAGAATLETPERPRIPRLPNLDGVEWHPLTRAWWRNVWRSPMAGEYLETDVDGLGRLALLINAFYQTGDPKLMAEIRLQEARFGLSPVDRSRLQWEVAKGEEASTRRRRPSTPSQQSQERADPRDLLKVVS